MANKNKIVYPRGNLVRLVGLDDYEDFDFIPRQYTKPTGGKLNAQASKQAVQDSER